MEKQVKKYLKAAFYIAISIFALSSFISIPNSLGDISSYTGLSVFITIIISILYEKWAWKLNPFETTPRLLKKYKGTIEYNYSGQIENKEITVYFNQSLFHVKIKLVTNEIISSAITSKIVEENGHYILYYTYITNPKSRYSDANPIQYGTSRLIIDNVRQLNGIYWTSRKTKGDIYLTGSFDRQENIKKKEKPVNEEKNEQINM